MYAIDKQWLIIPGVGSTMHWDHRDIEWLEQGNIPKLNAKGYMIMPYGNREGKKVYNV